MTQPLVIRADASSEIGSGHVMRCLALAEHWRADGGEAVFVTTAAIPGLVERLAGGGFEVVVATGAPGSGADADATRQVAAERAAHWLAVDGYHFDAAFVAGVRGDASRVLVMDDDGRGPYRGADLVLNQNIGADPSLYPDATSDSCLLLGPRYALLRQEFRAWTDWHRETSDVAGRVLITFGASDPENHTLAIADELARSVPDAELLLLVGPGNPHGDALEAAARASSRLRLVRDPEDVAALMAGVDLAVAAAGSTAWELAFMMVPAVLVTTAENQGDNAAGLARLGAAACGSTADWPAVMDVAARLAADGEARRAMAVAGRSLVDGTGGARVVAAMKGVT